MFIDKIDGVYRLQPEVFLYRSGMAETTALLGIINFTEINRFIDHTIEDKLEYIIFSSPLTFNSVINGDYIVPAAEEFDEMKYSPEEMKKFIQDLTSFYKLSFTLREAIAIELRADTPEDFKVWFELKYVQNYS